MPFIPMLLRRKEWHVKGTIYHTFYYDITAVISKYVTTGSGVGSAPYRQQVIIEPRAPKFIDEVCVQRPESVKSAKVVET